MSQETYSPIQTPIGFLRGRDCIYLDGMYTEDHVRNLVLEGFCNGHLASDVPDREKDYEYTLRFRGVLAFRVIELDSWEHHYSMPVLMETSFWEVSQSRWLAQLRGGGKVEPSHRHFVVQTYDDVVEILCHDFEFIITV